MCVFGIWEIAKSHSDKVRCAWCDTVTGKSKIFTATAVIYRLTVCVCVCVCVWERERERERERELKSSPTLSNLIRWLKD